MKNISLVAALALALLPAVPAASRDKAPPTIDRDRVLAEEILLAGPGLRGGTTGSQTARGGS